MDETEVSTGIPPVAVQPTPRVSVSNLRSNDRAQNAMRDSMSNNLNTSGRNGVMIVPKKQGNNCP
jgi:hypothetical protein